MGGRERQIESHNTIIHNTKPVILHDDLSSADLALLEKSNATIRNKQLVLVKQTYVKLLCLLNILVFRFMCIS